jgi:hypothetical protein
MVEAESPFRTLLVCKKSKTKEDIAPCRTLVTSVTRRRHKGLDLGVILSCQTVVTFSSSSCGRGYFELTAARELRDYEMSDRRAQNLKFWSASRRDCMAQSLCNWLRATLHQPNTHSWCRVSASCCRPLTAVVRFKCRAESLSVGVWIFKSWCIVWGMEGKHCCFVKVSAGTIEARRQQCDCLVPREGKLYSRFTSKSL